MLEKLQLLIIGNDDGIMELIFEQLKKAWGSCVLEFTSSLSIACDRLAHVAFHAIILDPSIANHGRDMAITAIRGLAPETPLFLLVDRRCASDELRTFGPGDCLFKDELRQGVWVERDIEGWIYGKPVAKNR